MLSKSQHISQDKRNECLNFINKEEVHTEIRNLLMIILLPKKISESGSNQSAFLRAAISRVSLVRKEFNLFCIARPPNCVGERRIIYVETSV